MKKGALLILLLCTGCATVPPTERSYLVTRVKNTPVTELAFQSENRCLDMLSKLGKNVSSASSCSNTSANLPFAGSVISKSEPKEVVSGSARTMAGCLYFMSSFSSSGYAIRQNCTQIK